ncbi:Microtubule-actin cross-linking factor 1 [Takifugu flavidus]|uniref:Microtubule-actin cross-linking factor 1 n=1 Tax=Takifugu flavidus TaxID=433684 RepID=A0A5C6MXY2_9TELE|nr:Microtubule-actin cross-linking factor 1 [Takifugu flavidus]
MGNSIGCVRPPHEREPCGPPPLSPKKRLRFRRKHKGKKKMVLEKADFEHQRILLAEKEEEGDINCEEMPSPIETADLDCIRAQTLATVPDTQLIHSKNYLHGRTFSPGSLSATIQKHLDSKLHEVSPKPSPAWRGVFCLPGEEDTVSSIIDVSIIPSQTATDVPANTIPTVGCITPGGGRVCRVKEKVQGVLEKPWILKQKKEKKDINKVELDKRECGNIKLGVSHTLLDRERKDVVHIREVDGKLCVVKTVYPSDFGSPVWNSESQNQGDVNKDLYVPRQATGNIIKVELPEEEAARSIIYSRGLLMSSDHTQETEFSLDAPDHAQELCLLESGYASDLPLTSPETAGTTPCQTDWGGLTGSSSERLDSMIESPLSMQLRPDVESLPQVCLFFASFLSVRAANSLTVISEIYVSGESSDLSAKEKLLIWSQQATEGYPGLRCANFTSCWSDGRMFNALLHRYRPDLIDMEIVSQQSNQENLEQAFEIAESLGVTRLLDAEDVDVPSPDEKSVITYVSSIYDAFPKIPEGGEGILVNEVDKRWSEYQSRFSSLVQWSHQHTANMANKNFPQNPAELKALYNEYVHLKETEIPIKEVEKAQIEHLYKLLEMWIEFGRIKLPQGFHPNDLEEEWGKLILEMLEREKALRPAVERLELLLQRANKIQNMALECEEKLTLAKNTLQADMSRIENGESVQCERELACYLQDCEALNQHLNQELKVLRDEKYYQEELVSFRLQCSSIYRKGHFSQSLSSTGAEHTSQRAIDGGLTLGQTLIGTMGAVGAALLRRPMARSQLVAMSSSEDEGSLRFIYELLGWVEETQELLEQAEWGADLPTVENNLQKHNNIHTAVKELMSSVQEARTYEAKVSPNYKISYSDTLAKLEHQYCKLLEHSSWRLQSLESLHGFVARCTEELIWLNEREEEEISFDWSDNNPNLSAKRELYSEMKLELDAKQEAMQSLQETAHHLCQENHPAKQTVEAYSAALQTQWQWVNQLCLCVEEHLKDNSAYFQYTSDARECESYLRQLQDTIKRQYTCDKNSRLSKLEDLLQDSMEEKEQLIEYRSTVASLVGRAKTVVQLRPRGAENILGSTTLIKAICDYRQIEITINRGEECVLQDNSQRTKWKVISTTGNEAMVPSVCFTVPPPNLEAISAANRVEQLYQKVMSLWHQQHVNMKSVVSWHYLLKDIRNISGWNVDTVRCQSPAERQEVLTHLESHLADFLADSKESTLFTPGDRRQLEEDAEQAQQHFQKLVVNMETVEKDESVSRAYLSELQNITLHLKEAEQRLMTAIETPGRPSADGADVTLQIEAQKKLQSELGSLCATLGDLSGRCISFFEEKPTSSSIPALRSELNYTMEKTDQLHNLSSVYLEKLKTIDILLHGLNEAESQVRKNESRLSEEDIVPADITAIKSLRDQLGKWQAELAEHEDIFHTLQSRVDRAKEVGSQLNRLHPDRSPELERYQERASQIAERWNGIKRQMETRRTDLEALGAALKHYRDGHSDLINWIEDTTQRQENTPPGQTDSRGLSEQLAQQTALVAEIEQNQIKLNECQTHSKQYCTLVKDYELQLMTYRAFVESTHKSSVKRRRMHSSSDAITQEFMDLRTRYTALVTFTTQHVKYISDALRRLEEEEKEVEEEKQARVDQVSDLLGWVKGLQQRSRGPTAESSLAAQQAITEQLSAKKDEVAEAIRNTQVFLMSKQANILSPEERSHVDAQLDELTATYSQLCDTSTQQLQQLEQQLASEEEKKLERALLVVKNTKSSEGQQQNVLSVSAAMAHGLITQEEGLRILELQLNTGGLRTSAGLMITLKEAEEKQLLTPVILAKLQGKLQHRELVDPNTAEQLNLHELRQRCVTDSESRLLLPVQQQPGGTVCLSSGKIVGMFSAVQEGLIDRKVAVRLLEAQLFAGGIVDHRSGDRLTVNEALRGGLMDQELACALFARQLQNGGILDAFTEKHLHLEESIHRDLLSSGLAPVVLESLCTFAGMLWPESGEIMPIVEALQQGVISGELSRNILKHRHVIGALYNPETLQLLPLTQPAEQYLDPSVVLFLKGTSIPDVLSTKIESVIPAMNRSSRYSTWSVPPSLPPLPSGSSEAIEYTVTSAHFRDSKDELKHRLMVHLVAHSYVDAHTGKRLLLLDPELNEMVKANLMVSEDLTDAKHIGSQSTLPTYEQGKLKKDQVKAALAKTTEKGKTEGLKKEEKKDEVEEKPSLSQETERLQPAQDVKKINEVDLPQKHPLPDEEKAALILKANDSILKKGFVKGVSKKQTVTELQTSRNELAKKESQHPAVRDLKFRTLSSELSGEGNYNDKDNNGSKHHHSSQFENTVKSKESKLEPAMVKEDAAVEGFLENGTTKTVPLKTSSEEQGKHGSPKEYIQEIETDQLAPSKEKNKEIVSEKQREKNKIPKVRQECLGHDQSIVALVSMVRHIEVQLKQQQQQSVGRSLITLDDIIRQAETLDLELCDLESEVNRELVAAEQMLKHQHEDIPPQLLLALEKDKQSLARGYEAARALSVDILQSLKDHKESRQAAITAEKTCLEEQVENLLTWLVDTESRMNGGMVGVDKREKADKDVHCEQLLQQLSLCKAKRAQDLAPEQSRQLLRQLQQLQRTFHGTSGQAQAWADALSAQKEREAEWQRRELEKKEAREKHTAGEREAVQQDLQTKHEVLAEAIRSVEDLLTDKGDSLSPQERENLQVALTRMKEQYSALTDAVEMSLSDVDTAINTTAKAEEEIQDTQSQIYSLLNELSSLNQPDGTGDGSGAGDFADAASLPPEDAVALHTENLHAELQQLQNQQAQLLQITQTTRALLEQPDSTVPPEEKQRLRVALDQLQTQHQDRLQSCQHRLRKSEALKDELTKFLQEHRSFVVWLDQSEEELRYLGEGETDAQGLKDKLDDHRKKVLDTVQGVLEQSGGTNPALCSTSEMVTDKLQDANHRYTALHTKSAELGSRLSGLLERYQQYQDEVVSLHSWLSTQEQNQSIVKPSGETDPQNLQNTLRHVQLLQDELAEHLVQLEKVKRAGRDLVSTDESPSLKAVDILCAADGLQKRFDSLSSSVSERAEQLQTAVAQSVSVQEGLKCLLSWLDKLQTKPGPVEATAHAVQDALTQNQKLRQELLSRQGSVEATRDSVSKFLNSSDAPMDPDLLSALDELTQRYTTAQTCQAELEVELKALLPRLESYERLGYDLQVFTQSRLKALSPVGQPDRSIVDYRQTIEEVQSELEQEAGQLKTFCNLGTDLSQSKALNNTQILLDNVKELSDEFNQLEDNVKQRLAAIQACDQQLVQFRGLSGSLLRWLQSAQDQLQSKEGSLTTEGLQRRVQQLKDLLNDWESQQSRVRELNKTGSELESVIIHITGPQTKTGAPQINGSAGPSSVNGIHTCKDLTELQVAMSDVNGQYEALGAELKDHLGHQQASLGLRQKAKQGTEELKNWLTERELSLKQAQTASPSRPEVLLSELAKHSGQVEELKSTLRKLIADSPDSPEVDSWRQQLQDIDSRWQTTNQKAAQRQTELEMSVDRLSSFASMANQLGPWLREKELMMSVLGPLSIDPNMLNTQKQQVQFMLREFETRRPQFDQLTQSAEGILSQTGNSSEDSKDLVEVKAELGSISQQWEDLTQRLSQRSNHIDQAQGTSERFQALLRELSSSISTLSERLDAQASLSAQPEALKLRLQETGEIRSELERRRVELAEAEQLCQELSAIVAEPYLKEELSKRLESISNPLKSLEERAADGLFQLQTALSSTQQFQQMFEELRSWLDQQANARESFSDSLPCQPVAIRSLLAQTGELQRGIASQRGSYELIQAEGVSLLASLPAGGDERSALQSRLTTLKQDWEELNQRISDQESRLKMILTKADLYQQHKAELTPWLLECEQKEAEIQPSLNPLALNDALQKARSLSMDLERRQPLMEAFNTAVDQLLEQCCIGEEEVRDEKAQINRRVDNLGERIHNRTSQLEELSGRLKEFEDGWQAAERRLEAAKHQIEVQEALGPQACSAKSLERLRSQQDSLKSLKPQVVYLRDLAQGLVRDSPQTQEDRTMGVQRLQRQADDLEKEFDDVTYKIEECCSSLESRLQGVSEVQSHIRDVFSRLADLDDELDSLSPVGRDADSLASQADSLQGFLSRLTNLRTELEGHASECTSMLRREGSSPDLLALRRETEALNRQAGKLNERGQAKLGQVEDAAERVHEFYRLVAELQDLLGSAEEGLTSQSIVGTEVEMIKQQLKDFKVTTEDIQGGSDMKEQ